MAADVTYPAAAAAGLLSFLSPCVLPLVPPYLTFLAGTGVEELSAESESRARKDIFLAALLFVLGFSTVFVALGATASVFGQWVRANLQLFSVAAGLAIVVMGLHFLGLFKVRALYREKRVDIAKPPGPFGAYIMGLAFAFGWTPCIGPILASILAVAGTQETVWRGSALLAVYSLALGAPFLLAALAMETFLSFINRFKAHFGKVEKTVGVLLVLTGIAFLTGAVQDMSYWLLQTFPGLASFG